MASPLPSSTPYVPTVAMSSPSSGGTTTLTPMQVDTVRTATSNAPPRKQTAHRGGGPPRGS
jgi:hypothetical protein